MKKRLRRAKTALSLLAAVIVLGGVFPVYAAETSAAAVELSGQFISTQKALLDEPAMEYRAGSRWWMSNGLHTDETIKAGVKEFYGMGLGFIEMIFRNGNERLPEDLDTSPGNEWGWTPETTAAEVYHWGSEEWRNDSRLVITEATKYGLGFAMTSGTNWGNANVPASHLNFDDDGASKALAYNIQVVRNGDRFNDTLTRAAFTKQETNQYGTFMQRQDLLAVVAVKRDDSSDIAFAADNSDTGQLVQDDNFPLRKMVYDHESAIVLTGKVTRGGAPVTAETLKDPTGSVDFVLDWTPPDDGIWDVYTFWIQATGGTASPTASQNITINYIDKAGTDALIHFYEDYFFDDELKEIIKENGKGEVYMDSIELGTGQGFSLWGYTFLDQFKERNGYDLTPYLPFIIRTGGRGEFYNYLTAAAGDEDGVMVDKIRNDVNGLQTDCYINNTLLPLKNWLNEELNMKLRAEVGFNLPWEVTLSGRGVDYVETESLDMGEQIETNRRFAAAANFYGKRLSAETGALGGQNYVHGMERYLQMINTQFAAGVQHIVWHGYSSISGVTPENTDQWTPTYWPVIDIMSQSWSDRIGPEQPAFAHYGDLMTKIARDQAILQQGKAQVDLAVMYTDYHMARTYEGNILDEDAMRNRKAVFLKDLSLQDAGYTYNFLAPENLEYMEDLGIVDYREGEGMVPDRAGYQAMIVFQEELRVESAQKILELAQKGMPVIFVNGLVSRIRTATGGRSYGVAVGPTDPRVLAGTTSPASATVNKLHDEAASHTMGYSESDSELAAVISRIKELDNVVELDPQGIPTSALDPDPEAWGYDDENYYGKTGILEALQELGVRPRAEYAEPNKNYFTVTRKTDDTLYVWVYNFMSDTEFRRKPVEFDIVNDIDISIDGAGKPYSINTWTGEISELGEYTVEDGRTVIDLSLVPGETTVIALDLNNPGDELHVVSTDADEALLNDGVLSVRATESGTYTTNLSNGEAVVSEIKVPSNISLSEWDLTVTDWTRGELKHISEDRGRGYTTTESYWTTDKTPINVGKTGLISWKDIPVVGDKVSGTGTYTAVFELPADWSDSNGAYLDIESLNRNTAYVWVNNQRAAGLDIVSGRVDVSELLKPGKNTIKVEVSSTLRNRMVDLKYPGVNPDSTNNPGDGPFENGTGRVTIKIPPADYGMVGDVTLVTYTVEAVLQ